MSGPGDDLAARDRALLRILDTAGEEAKRRAGSWLSCRPGCAECCIGPFPITRLDARRLADGLAALTRDDPARAAALRARVSRDVDEQRESFPGDPATGALAEEEEPREAFWARFGSSPCPVLDPQTLTCALYAWRPVSCRTYGPPVRIGGEDLPPCRLCFVGATAGAVQACRVEPDPDGLEDALLDRVPGDDRETTVTFALGAPRTRTRC